MMSRIRQDAGSWVCGVFSAIVLGLCASNLAASENARQTADEALAREILEATGVKGGLIVHLGCGDGKLTAALRVNDGYVVHGLDADADAKAVRQARKYIQTLGLDGAVSVDRFDGKQLPYTDNLVNLLVAEDLGDVPMDEVMRVLTPHGVAYVKTGGTWTKTVKPWPEEIDEWTHFLHGPDNNAVANDTVVGPPRHVQWVGGPKHARQHDHLASMSAAVSAGGRLFTISDEGPIGNILLPAEWTLVARDAFNGLILWKRPIPSWENHLRRFRSGPAELSRRLVAGHRRGALVGDRVYVTLGYDAPVSVLDAATGRTLRIFEQTQGTDEIIVDAGVLYLVLGDPKPIREEQMTGSRGPFLMPKRGPRRLAAVRADTGQTLWTKTGAEVAGIMPVTLAVGGDRLFFQNPGSIICLDRRTGSELWRSDHPIATDRASWSTPTLVVYQDVVLSADRVLDAKLPAPDISRESREYWTFFRGGPSKLVALSAKTGQQLWECPCAESFHAPIDVFVADGLVWVGQDQARWLSGGLDWLKTSDGWYKEEPTLGRDPLTGEIKRRLMAGGAYSTTGHHRCYRNKATDRFMLLGRLGVEFIDFGEGNPLRHNWIRGACQYGILPSNGLLYVTPHACACFSQSKLSGFWALAPGRQSQPPGSSASDENRLEQGPAHNQIRAPQSAVSSTDQWPTYRHDAARSGSTKGAVPAQLKRTWQTEIGGKLSSVVVSDGKVFVSQIDAHTVHALDTDSGQRLWDFVAGGRVDSPPTACNGRVVFGSADGSVYCLRAADGELAWRYRVAPEDRRIVARGGVESTWPVTGSVLVDDGVVVCTAGRSSYLDGGMVLCRLDLETGRKLSETSLCSVDPVTGAQPEEAIEGMEMPGWLPDVLSCDGRHVFLRDTVFDRQGRQTREPVRHLFSPVGFLDDTWWHRGYWIYGTHFSSGAGGWSRAGKQFPAGRILAFDEETIYGFGRRRQYYSWTTPNEYHLFAAPKSPPPAKAPESGIGAKQRRGGPNWRPTWSQPVPLHVRAMVLADRTLFVAGPPDLVDEGDPQGFMYTNPLPKPKQDEALAAWQRRRGALLWAVSVADGSKLAAYELKTPPVWDGLIAVGGRLYLATTDGRVTCFGN